MNSHTFRNLALFIIFLIIGAGAGWYFFQNKSTPIVQNEVPFTTSEPIVEDFNALKTTYTIVPAEENSAGIFNAIPKDAIAKSGKNVLASFEKGVNKKYYQCSLAAEEDCHLNTLRDVANLAATNSIQLYKDGKAGEARTYAQKIVKLGQMITASTDDVIELLIGWLVQKTGYYTLTQIKPTIAISTNDKALLINNLREEQKKALKVIYTRTIESIDYITDSNKKPSLALSKTQEEVVKSYRDIKTGFNWHPDETKKWYYDSAKIELANVDLACGSDYKNSVIDIKFNPDAPDAELKNQENYIGKIMYSLTSVSLSAVNVKRCDIEALINTL